MHIASSLSQHAIGWIDEPESEGIVGPAIRIRGWALARSGVAGVEIRVEQAVFRARIGLPRSDVADVRPGYPDNPFGGFEFEGDVGPAPRGIVRRRIAIVAIAHDGAQTLLGERTLIERDVHARWRFAARDDAPPFFIVPAVSGVATGGAFGIDTRYSAYASAATRVGMRVPVLYMRTTTGRGDGYRFDADFDTTRQSNGRAIADDSLSAVLQHASARRLPVLVTLNGGIWSDAGGTATEWDLTDRLEEDPANCQWNEHDAVMPDDHLRDLPGSQHAPELARALTLNVYARAVRSFKRRNLQQAAAPIVGFARDAPELFIGVNLDPDVYINPFFGETQWYDYNPGTLRQFRDWLAGGGPYAGRPDDDVPDLSAFRRAQPLSLQDVSALARREFHTWDDVDPPRAFPRDGAHPFWTDPWVAQWETFRRHLVALHYDELAQWLVDAGVPRDSIWTSQGLMAPADDCMPLALHIDSPVKNYDSGGVSIAGSMPRNGHLGAIVYGAAAANAIAMENGSTLFATLAGIDPAFAIVEFNTADLRNPRQRPTYATAYRALRDLWNAGARFVSPMAWNGSNGADADAPDYVSYTGWRNTPLEEATRDFLLARSGLPLGTKLWTFGTQVHADDDGWTAPGAGLVAHAGAIRATADPAGRMTLVSPPRLGLTQDVVGSIVLGIADDAAIAAIDVAARAAGADEWRTIAHCTTGALQAVDAGRIVRFTPGAVRAPIDQLRIAITLIVGRALTISRIAILRS
jgi:hypothetical protein